MRIKRTCPLCGSKAVSATDEGELELHVRCGECGTWRAAATGRRAAAALERRLKRDRERMAVSMGQGARWRELEFERLARWPPQRG